MKNYSVTAVNLIANTTMKYNVEGKNIMDAFDKANRNVEMYFFISKIEESR